MKLRLPGRFEWKILGAFFTVACLTLGAAGYLVSLTLSQVSAITDRHKRDVGASLGGAVEAYRVYFAQMKDAFRERGAQIAAGSWDRTADLASVPDLVRARVLVGDQVVDEWSVSPTVLEHTREAPPTLVELPGSTAETPRLLELTFGISSELYGNFLSLRQAMEQEHELDRLLPVVLPMIFRGLGIALVIVLAVATVLGLFVARRATGRVARLREAARRVGEGDLSVRVHPRGRDELDELGRAFDRMVAELGDTRSRLEYLQKVSAWQEVARRLAHEIKNPLTPIQLAVQELASKYQGDSPSYQRLLGTAQEILKEEIGAIRRLVDDFSAFAKLPKVEPTPVDLAQIVEDFARTTEWQPVVRVERDPQRVDAFCDRMLIRRVLANLVENAVQAAEGAARKPDVVLRVHADAARNVAQLVVDDNGPGLGGGARARLFDPYVTTKEHGTGLGLAIVRKIVIDHGGDVIATDAPAPLGGARFIVEIPAGGAAEIAGRPAPGSPPPPSG